jgi:hypothetical protein
MRPIVRVIGKVLRLVGMSSPKAAFRQDLVADSAWRRQASILGGYGAIVAVFVASKRTLKW